MPKFTKVIINHPDKSLVPVLQKELPDPDFEIFYLADYSDLKSFAARSNPQIIIFYIDPKFLSNKKFLKYITDEPEKNIWFLFLVPPDISEASLAILDEFEHALIIPQNGSKKALIKNIKSLILSKHKNLLERSRQQYNEYMLHCMKLINQEYSMPGIYERLINYLPKIFPFDYWGISTFDPQLGQIQDFIQFIPPLRRNSVVLTHNLEKLALTWSLENRTFQVRASEDVQLFNKLGEWGWKVNQIIFIPIESADINMGGIVMGNVNPLDVSEQDIDFFKELSSVLAKQVFKVMKFGKLNQTADNFSDQLIYNHFSEDSILQLTCKKINDVTEADSTVFWQINRGFGFCFPKYSYFKEGRANWKSLEKNLVFLNKDNFFNQLVKTEESVLLNNFKEKNTFSTPTLETFEKLQYNNLLIAPVRVQNEEVGLVISNKQENRERFMPWEMEWVEDLLEKIHIVLDDTHIVKEANLKLKQLARIFELGNELKLDLNIEDILTRILQSIRKTLGWNDVAVLRCNTFRKVYQPVSSIGFDKKHNSRFNFSASIAFDSFEKFTKDCKKISASFFYDSQPVSPHENGLTEEMAAEWHDADLLTIPVETRGKHLGYLIVSDPVDRLKPTEDRVKPLEYFANQSAVAIDNSILYENLLASEERYRSLAETMTLSLVTCNFEEQILYANPAFEKLLAVDRKKLARQPLTGYFSRHSRKKIDEIVASIKNTDEHKRKNIENVELELISENRETIPVSTFAFPFYQQRQKVGFFLVLNDLRVIKKLERLKADFNSMIVHDLRSPMNVIQGFIELIRNRVVGPVNSEQEELLDIAKENVKKVLTLVDNFLVASKIEVGKFSIEPKVSELNSLLERIIDNHQILIKNKNIQLVSELNRNLPLLFFDTLRIEQVLNNLLSNAVKFTPDNGKITISTDLYQKVIKGEEKFFARIGVHDTGVGISKEKLKNVFEKYEQAESELSLKSAGTGLGLSICKEIVHLHGGEIWAESELKKGSDFYFTLPIEPSIEKFIK